MPRACFLAILRLMAALVGSGTLTTADNGRAVLSVALMAFFGETPEVSVLLVHSMPPTRVPHAQNYSGCLCIAYCFIASQHTLNQLRLHLFTTPTVHVNSKFVCWADLLSD